VSPQSGTYVRSLSDKEIQDLLELRLLLEAQVMRSAAAHISAEELRKLRRALEKACPRGIDRADEASFDDFNEFDSLFHLSAYRAAGNGLIAGILVDLIDKVQWLKSSAPGSTRRIRSGFHELERILAALEARDAERAAALMREHILNAADYAASTRGRR
jgi:DNA-binding GntR family transcriptional regulator